MAQLQRRDFLRMAAASTSGAVLFTALGKTEAGAATSGDTFTLYGRNVRLNWRRGADGWQLADLRLNSRRPTGFVPSGQYGIWWSTATSAPVADEVRRVSTGTHSHFWPEQCLPGTGVVTFTSSQPTGAVKAAWTLDGDDIAVAVQFTPNADGWYSIASPTLATLPADDLGVPVIDVSFSTRSSTTGSPAAWHL